MAMAVTLADSPPSSHSSPLQPFAGDALCGSIVADHPQVLLFFFLFTYLLENSGFDFLKKIIWDLSMIFYGIFWNAMD